MRVAFVGHRTHANELGGADRSLLSLVDRLRSLGIDPVAVLPKHGVVEEAFHRLGVPCQVISFSNAISLPPWARDGGHKVGWCRAIRRRARHLWDASRGVPKIVSVLRREAVDVVYSNSLVTSVGWISAKVAGLPHVWHLRELPDLARGIYPDVGWPIYRWMIGHSDATVANSFAVQRAVVPKAALMRSRVVYNGVVPESAFGKEERRNRKGPVVFALVGGISPAKGQAQAIRAFSVVRSMGADARLIIAGGGDPAELMALASAAHVDTCVDFIGYVTDPWQVWDAADVALMCSPSEPMGRVTAEAMSAGLLVIGRAGGGTVELLNHGKTGLLYDGTDQDLARWMTWAVSNDQHGRSIGRAAKEVARNHFTVERYAAAVCEVIHAAAERRATQPVGTDES